MRSKVDDLTIYTWDEFSTFYRFDKKAFARDKNKNLPKIIAGKISQRYRSCFWRRVASLQNAVGGEAVISFVQQQHVGICFTGCLAKGNYDSGLLAMGSFPPSKKGSLKEKGRRNFSCNFLGLRGPHGIPLSVSPSVRPSVRPQEKFGSHIYRLIYLMNHL